MSFSFKEASLTSGRPEERTKACEIVQHLPCKSSDTREVTKKGEQQWLRVHTRTSESKPNRKERMGRDGPVQPEVNWPWVKWSNWPDDITLNQGPLQFLSESQIPQENDSNDTSLGHLPEYQHVDHLYIVQFPGLFQL